MYIPIYLLIHLFNEILINIVAKFIIYTCVSLLCVNQFICLLLIHFLMIYLLTLL